VQARLIIEEAGSSELEPSQGSDQPDPGASGPPDPDEDERPDPSI
jgi:hypothetical protein